MESIMLYKENPKYFSFKEKPLVLITSASHYGAPINRLYNYRLELDELHKHGLNLVRIFGGHYKEIPGDFGISNNILGPEDKDYICPFIMREGKYSLTEYNPEYFERLEEYVGECQKRDIILEISIFCPFYHDGLWEISPFNSKNNINDIEEISRFEFHTLKNKKLLQLQEQYVEKIIKTVNKFDNVYFEIVNEPWVTEIPVEFELYFARFIIKTEALLPNTHMIARNPANGWERVTYEKEISLLNFHYASPPFAVKANEDLPCAIGLNETGFKGTDIEVYRKQAWEFILSGGALFNNLDYSFTVGYENGTWFNENDPGAGNSELRAQLGLLTKIINSIDLKTAKPDMAPIRKCHALHGQGLCITTEKEYLFYFASNNELFLTLDIPEGEYVLDTVNAITGETNSERIIISHGYQFRDVDFKRIGEMALLFRRCERSPESQNE